MKHSPSVILSLSKDLCRRFFVAVLLAAGFWLLNSPTCPAATNVYPIMIIAGGVTNYADTIDLGSAATLTITNWPGGGRHAVITGLGGGGGIDGANDILTNSTASANGTGTLSLATLGQLKATNDANSVADQAYAFAQAQSANATNSDYATTAMTNRVVTIDTDTGTRYYDDHPTNALKHLTLLGTNWIFDVAAGQYEFDGAGSNGLSYGLGFTGTVWRGVPRKTVFWSTNLAGSTWFHPRGNTRFIGVDFLYPISTNAGPVFFDNGPASFDNCIIDDYSLSPMQFNFGGAGIAEGTAVVTHSTFRARGSVFKNSDGHVTFNDSWLDIPTNAYGNTLSIDPIANAYKSTSKGVTFNGGSITVDGRGTSNLNQVVAISAQVGVTEINNLTIVPTNGAVGIDVRNNIQVRLNGLGIPGESIVNTQATRRLTFPDAELLAMKLSAATSSVAFVGIVSNNAALNAATNTAVVVPSSVTFTQLYQGVSLAQRSQWVLSYNVTLTAGSGGIVFSNATSQQSWSNQFTTLTINEDKTWMLPTLGPSQTILINTNGTGITVTGISQNGI